MTGVLLHILGGVGLFTLGIYLMGQGFTRLAGYSLRRLLSQYTNSTFKGIVSGCLISALVQSSSAVIVSVLGFIHARLIKLKQAIPIVYGANLGKVITIWLIATLGFKWDMAQYGVYAVGFGALAQTFIKQKSGAGLAIMGFGVVFMGLSTLKTSFSNLEQTLPEILISHPGLFGMLLFFILGMGMSIIMQSSTGAIVLSFSALDAGLINIENATALVIGQNLGSISSSILASIGTSPMAKRLSAVHVLFNVTVTFISLILLSGLILFVKHNIFIEHKVLAITTFYSIAIALSLLILLPLENWILKALSHYFENSNRLGKPLFIRDEKTLLPSTAILALKDEIWHFARLSTDVLNRALKWDFKEGWVQSIDLSFEEHELDLLIDDIQWFATKSSRKQSAYLNVQPIYYGLTLASRHFENACDFSKKIAQIKSKLSSKLNPSVFENIKPFTENIRELGLLLAGVREETDGFLFPDIEDFFVQAKTEKAKLAQELLKLCSTKDILYSDAMLLLEILDLALAALDELFLGTKETLLVLKTVPQNFDEENNVILFSSKLKS